jgi:hypothetical protein
MNKALLASHPSVPGGVGPVSDTRTRRMSRRIGISGKSAGPLPLAAGPAAFHSGGLVVLR